MTFLNTAVQLVLLNLIIWKSELPFNLWKDNGLANDLWFLLLLSILDILGSLLKPDYLKKLWDRRKLEKGEGRHGNFRPNQIQVNQIYEGFDFCFEERLSKYCKLLLITLFISCLFPLSPLISVIYLLIFYWLDKLSLLRLCRVPNFCTSQIGHSMLRFFDLALVVYTVISSDKGKLLALPQHHYRCQWQNRSDSLRCCGLHSHLQYQVLDESYIGRGSRLKPSSGAAVFG